MAVGPASLRTTGGIVNSSAAAQVQPSLFGAAEERRLDLSQWYTDPAVAHQMVKSFGVHREVRVLEPAAGQGALIHPVLRLGDASVVAYELDPTNLGTLEALGPRVEVRGRDFLADPDPGRFDVVVMNSPYEDDQDVDFVLRALEVAPRAVALLRAAFDYSAGRWDRVWRWVDPRRRVRLSARPSFGEGTGARSDFQILELTRRTTPRSKGEAVSLLEEWW